MNLHIVTYNDPVLRKKCKKIENFDADLEFLAGNLIETINKQNASGLAAPQVGVPIRLFVSSVNQNYPEDAPCFLNGKAIPSLSLIMPLVMVNAEIIEASQELQVFEEGCMSIPGGVYADVARPQRIKVQYQDLKGMTHTVETEGFLATNIQHEIDHLNGVLFIDHITPRAKRRLTTKLKQLTRDTKAFMKAHKSCSYPIAFEG